MGSKHSGGYTSYTTDFTFRKKRQKTFQTIFIQLNIKLSKIIHYIYPLS